jgi:DNA-binding response OmpR family regulator
MSDTYLKEKKILIVDDEESLREMLISILSNQDYTKIVAADTVRTALQVCQRENPDIAILDVMLPDGDGFILMEELRKFTDIPVIFLTAKDEIQDKFSGFGLGADDYITKPFLPKELLYRLNAVLRRCYKEDNPVIELHDCSIDLNNAQVIKNNKILSLTAKEHDILEVLSRNMNRIVTIDALCESAWGENPYGYENSLMSHIRRIREKIEENPSSPVSLITIKGLGYKLITEGR